MDDSISDKTKAFQERIGRIEGLVRQLETAADPAVRKAVRQLLEALMELHGAGLERILETVDKSGAPDQIRALGNDPLVSSLLVLYGLHPDDFETRARAGLEKVRPLLRSEGAHLEAIDIGENSIRIKIVGSESRKLEQAIWDALIEAAPDAAEIEVEGTSLKGSGRASDFVPLAALTGAAITNS
jgi:hypothetical protein